MFDLTSSWYQEFIEEIKVTLTEGEFSARWELITCYHKVGLQLIKAKETYNVPLSPLCKAVAQTLGRSERTVYYMAQFAQKYPDLTSAPLEKHISWRGVIKLLEEGVARKPCEHLETGYYEICKKCGKNLGEEESEY